MAKPRTLANSVADGGPLANGDPTIADVTGLQAALDAKANSASLATVATSGSYNDLSNKPTPFTTGKAIAMAIVFGG